MTMTASPVVGRPLWYELMTGDMKAAEAFYDKVVGWTSAPFEALAHAVHHVQAQR